MKLKINSGVLLTLCFFVLFFSFLTPQILTAETTGSAIAVNDIEGISTDGLSGATVEGDVNVDLDDLDSDDDSADGTINGLITTAQNILEIVIPALLVIATLVFIWGVITYILAKGSEERKKQGYTLIIWGLVGLFVIVTMWGLVRVIGKTFGIEEKGIPSGSEIFNIP